MQGVDGNDTDPDDHDAADWDVDHADVGILADVVILKCRW